MMKSNTLRVGFVQTPLMGKTPDENLVALLKLVARVLKHRPDLVMLPELFLGGPHNKSARYAFSLVYREALQELGLLAKGHTACFYGSFLERRQSRFYNSAGWVTPSGKLTVVYQKNHLFQFYHEHRLYTAGRQSGPFLTPWGKVAPLICYDLRFPELLRKMVFLGARMVLVSAQWPATRAAHWLTLLRARAIENQIIVLACNRIGRNHRGDRFAGQSCVITPWGKVARILSGDQVSACVEVDLSSVETVRSRYPFLKDALQRRIRFEV